MITINYHHVKTNNVFHIKISGKTNPDHIVDFATLLFNEKKVPVNCSKILCNLNDAQFVESALNYSNISSALNQLPITIRNFRLALLTNSPKETASLMLLSKKINIHKTALFSTPRAAAQWLENEE